MISSVKIEITLINKNRMKAKKVLKIMNKKYGWQGDITKEQKIFTQSVINATLEAINYTPCCKEFCCYKTMVNKKNMSKATLEWFVKREQS